MLELWNAYNLTSIGLQSKINHILIESLGKGYEFYDKGELTDFGYQPGALTVKIEEKRVYQLTFEALPDKKLKIEIYRVAPDKDKTKYRLRKESDSIIDNNSSTLYDWLEVFVAAKLEN